MDLTKRRFNRIPISHRINLLTPDGRKAVDIHLVKLLYRCLHCLGPLKGHNAGVICTLNNNHYGYIHRDEAKELTQQERFMKIGKMFPSDYLRGLDIDKPFIVTIKSVTAEKARDQDGKMVDEFVMRFEELDKKLRLNLTMAKAAALALADEEADTDNWIGKRVTIYQDKVKSFGKEHIVPRIREVRRDDVDLKKAIQQAKPEAASHRAQANGKPANGGPSFDDLLKKLNDELGLDESTAKTLLKEDLGFKSYKPSEFQKMFDSVQAIIPKQAPLIDELGFESEEEPVGAGAYSEDM